MQAIDLEAVRALISAGKYLEAEETALKTVASLDAAGGAPDAELAELLDLVLQARRIGRRLGTPGTAALGERALALKEAAFGADDARVSQTLMLLALACSANREHDRARRTVERAIAIRERALGPDHVDVAAAYSALASIQRAAGQQAQAADAAERALAVARRAEQPPGNETASALSALATASRMRGDIERAVRLSEEVLTIDERLRGPEHPSIAGTLLVLSGALWDLGDAERSRALHDRAIGVLERSPGSDRRLAFEYISLASKLENMGDYANGFALAERGVAASERTTGPASALTAAALDQLAQMQNHLGDRPAAQASRARAVEIWRAAQGPDSVHVATALNALAESFEDAGQMDEAFAAVERALRIEALAQQPAVYSRVLQTHARLLSARGERTAARADLERARQVSAAAPFATARTDLAMTLTLLARLEREDGQPARALPLYREAIALFQRELGPTHIRTAERRTEYAAALAEAGDLAQARVELAAGEGASVEHLRLVARTLSDRRALEFAAERVSGVDLAVTLATQAAARRAPAPATVAVPAAAAATAADIAAGWQTVIRARTVVLDEMAARQRVIVAEANQTVVRDRWTAVTRARSRLANLIIRGSEGFSAEQYQELVQRTSTERDAAERDLAQASLAFRQEQRRQRASPQDVVARLPPGAALVSYVRYTPQRIAGDAGDDDVARAGGVGSERGEGEGAGHAGDAVGADDSRGGLDARGSVGAGDAGPAERAGRAGVVAQAVRTDAADQTARPGPAAGTGIGRGGGRAASGAATMAARVNLGGSEGQPHAVAGGADRASVGTAYAAFIARAGMPLRVVPLGPADALDAAIAGWRAGIQAELTAAGLGGRRTESDYRAAGAALRARLWDPVRPHLGPASSVFIVPDGAIHLVDFSTLPIGTSGYLVQEPVTLHYLLAERDLVQPSTPPAGHRLLALGAADFDTANRAPATNASAQPLPASSADSATMAAAGATPVPAAGTVALAAAPAAARAAAGSGAGAATAGGATEAGAATTGAPATSTASTETAHSGPAPSGAAGMNSSATAAGVAAALAPLTTREAGSACDAFARRMFAPLPATRDETAHIATIWQRGATAHAVTASSNTRAASRDVALLNGDRATEAAFKSLAQGRRVLHLATHGFFLDRFCGQTSAAPMSLNAAAAPAVPAASAPLNGPASATERATASQSAATPPVASSSAASTSAASTPGIAPAGATPVASPHTLNAPAPAARSAAATRSLTSPSAADAAGAPAATTATPPRASEPASAAAAANGAAIAPTARTSPSAANAARAPAATTTTPPRASEPASASAAANGAAIAPIAISPSAADAAGAPAATTTSAPRASEPAAAAAAVTRADADAGPGSGATAGATTTTPALSSAARAYGTPAIAGTAAVAGAPSPAPTHPPASTSFLEESPLLRSGLVLAGANQRARRGREEEDGILTAEEIAGLDLSAAQWAVLSACDTGRGDWQAGEGVVGLRRAFLVAGARTVILSLWPVLDTVASEWMVELYRGKFVRDVTTGSAVRAASRTLLSRRRAAGLSTHPLYWAGFVATGDWH